jgi:hypothetical protein
VVVDLTDSLVPTVNTPIATAAGFTFTILNYSNLYTYSTTTTAGSVTRTADEVVVSGLSAGASATVTIAVTRANYKPATKTVVGSAVPAPTVKPDVVIDIQAPVTTVAQGQASVATIAPGVSRLLTPLPTTATTTTLAIANTPRVKNAAIPAASQLSPPMIPKVSTGGSALEVDGVRTKIDVSRNNNQMVVSAGSLSATLSGIDKYGKTAPLDSDGIVHLSGGDVIKINVGGFKAGSLVEVWLFSTPTQLGSARVDADGKMSAQYRLPLGLKSGAHRVVVTARMANGKPTTFTLGILVGNISKTSTLTRVLIAIPITLAIGFGFLLPTQLRRRRKDSPA